MQLFWPSLWKLTAGIFLIASLCHMKAGLLVATYIDVRGNKEEVDRAFVLLFVLVASICCVYTLVFLPGFLGLFNKLAPT